MDNTNRQWIKAPKGWEVMSQSTGVGICLTEEESLGVIRGQTLESGLEHLVLTPSSCENLGKSLTFPESVFLDYKMGKL